jgi:hypothetical protein
MGLGSAQKKMKTTIVVTPAQAGIHVSPQEGGFPSADRNDRDGAIIDVAFAPGLDGVPNYQKANRLRCSFREGRSRAWAGEGFLHMAGNIDPPG